MADIFLSYSREDHERVTLMHDALVKQGFDVVWDEKLPVGADWDTWIRGRLADSRSAIVMWSHHSVKSNNVRHEARIAQLQGKLVSVLLDKLAPDQLPIGQYTDQAADLSAWSGDPDDTAFVRLVTWMEQKLTPTWLAGVLEEKDRLLADARELQRVGEGQLRELRNRMSRDTAERLRLEAERDRVTAELSAAQQLSEAAIQAAGDAHQAREATLKRGLEQAQARAAELAAEAERQKAESEAVRAGSSRRWQISTALAVTLLIFIGLAYAAANRSTALAESELADSKAAVATLRDESRKQTEELASVRGRLATVTQDLEKARQPIEPPTQAAAKPPAPEPDPCPDPYSGRFWKGDNTFAVNVGFSRECVESAASSLHGSQSVIDRLFNPKLLDRASAQFVAYVLSANGVSVNPTSCSPQCLAQGLRRIATPAAGDVVLLINDAFGIYAADNYFYEMHSNGEANYVTRDKLSRAQVKAFLTAVPAKAAKRAADGQ